MRPVSEPEDPHDFEPLAPLQQARQMFAEVGAGADDAGLLEALRAAVPELRAEVLASGTPLGVTTGELVTFPYPTAFGLGRATTVPAPFLWVDARMLTVQWDDATGQRRTLLWCPFDHERIARPSFSVAGLLQRPPLPDRLVTCVHGAVLGHVRALGLDASDVDYLVFPHLQSQDLRRLLSTDAPHGSEPDAGATPWFPRARLIVQRRELVAAQRPHPLQRPWYEQDTFRDIADSRVLRVDGDVLLGPGVALIATPGRTVGSHSLVLHTDAGLWVASANGIAADSWSPTASGIPGVRRWAEHLGQEVLPDAGLSASIAAQYTSMVVENMVSDPAPDGEWRRILPAWELTSHALAPLLAPSHRVRGIEHGSVGGSAVVLEAATR